MPAFGRLVSGIMTGDRDHIAFRPGMMLDHASDPGTVCSVLALHDHLHISHDILHEQSVICHLQSAHIAESVQLAVGTTKRDGCEQIIHSGVIHGPGIGGLLVQYANVCLCLCPTCLM
jgi:hypothetical protein